MTSEVQHCLTPDCKKPARSSGCCINCYNRHLRAIRQGKTTRDKLVAVGLMQPKGVGKKHPWRKDEELSYQKRAQA